MSVPTGAAVAAARRLEQQGFFERVKTGDEKAASYFARLVAYTVNPDGDPSGFGWLKKTGAGFNVEGYADGAIVYGNDPSDLNNVVKIVTQIGTTHAGIGDAVQERRVTDVWDTPRPLTDAQMRYLNPAFEGGTVTPPAQPPVTPPPVVITQPVDLSPILDRIAAFELSMLDVVHALKENEIRDLQNRVADLRKAMQNGIPISAKGRIPYLGEIAISGEVKG